MNWVVAEGALQSVSCCGDNFCGFGDDEIKAFLGSSQNNELIMRYLQQNRLSRPICKIRR